MEKQYRKGHHKSIYRKESLEIAQQLCYSKKVIEMIEEAETDEEITNIMHDARLGLIK